MAVLKDFTQELDDFFADGGSFIKGGPKPLAAADFAPAPEPDTDPRFPEGFDFDEIRRAEEVEQETPPAPEMTMRERPPVEQVVAEFTQEKQAFDNKPPPRARPVEEVVDVPYGGLFPRGSMVGSLLHAIDNGHLTLEGAMETEDPNVVQFAAAAISDATLRPLVGILEGVGMMPEGVSAELREGYEQVKGDFIEVDGEDVTARKWTANTIAVAAAFIPLVPGSQGANLAMKIPRLANLGKKGARGVKLAADVAGGAALGFGEAQVNRDDSGELLGAGVGGGTAGLLPILGPGIRKGLRKFGVGAKPPAPSATIPNGGEIAEVAGRTTSQKLLELSENAIRRVFNSQLDSARIVRRGRKHSNVDVRAQVEKVDRAQQQLIISTKAAENGLETKPRLWNDGIEDFEDALVPDIEWDYGSDKWTRNVDPETGLPAMKAVPSYDEIWSRPGIEEMGEDFYEQLGYYMAYRRHLGKAVAAEAGQPGAKAVKLSDEATANARDFMQKHGEIYGTGHTIFDDVANDIRDVSHMQLIQLQKAGIINEESVGAMLASGPDYVPFHRLVRELDAGGKGGVVGEAMLKKLRKGLSKENPIVDPIAETFLQGVQINILVDKQLAGKAIHNLWEQAPELFGKSGLTPRTGASVVSSLTKAEREALGTDDVVQEAFRAITRDTEGGIPVWLPDPDDATKVTRQVFDASAGLAEALDALPPAEVNGMVKAAGEFTNFLRTSVLGSTTFAARQLVRDPVQGAMISKNGMLPFVSLAATAMRRSAAKVGVGKESWDKIMREFEQSGVMQTTQRNAARRGIEGRAELKRRALELPGRTRHNALAEKARRSGKHGNLAMGSIDLVMGSATNMVERNFRLTEYRLSREGSIFRQNPEVKRLMEGAQTVIDDAVAQYVGEGQGTLQRMMRSLTPQVARKNVGARESGFAASEVGLNFSRGGRTGRTYNMVEPFANAHLLDSVKFFSLMSNPDTALPTAIKGLAFIGAPALGLWARNRNDPSYHARPDYEKEQNLHIGQRSDGSWVKMPRPLGTGASILGPGMEAMAEAVMQTFQGQPNQAELEERFTGQWSQDGFKIPNITQANDPRSKGRAYDRFLSSLMDQSTVGLGISAVSGIAGKGGGSAAMGAIAPQAVQGAFEAWAGYDLFRDREIVPRRLGSALSEDVKVASTSDTAAFLSSMAPDDSELAKPIIMQHLINSYLGTMFGTEVVQGLTDPVLRGLGIADPDPSPGADPSGGIRRAPIVGSMLRAFTTPPTRQHGGLGGMEIEAVGFNSQYVRDLYELVDSADNANKRFIKLGEKNIAAKRKLVAGSPEVLLKPELDDAIASLSELSSQRREILADREVLTDQEKEMLVHALDQRVSLTAAYTIEPILREMLRVSNLSKGIDDGNYSWLFTAPDGTPLE